MIACMMLLFQGSDSGDEGPQLTGEKVTVFIENEEGEKRILVHDSVSLHIIHNCSILSMILYYPTF